MNFIWMLGQAHGSSVEHGQTFEYRRVRPD